MNHPGKRLQEIVRELSRAQYVGAENPLIASVEYDSRRVRDGSLFVAIPGLKSDARQFVRDAEARGAAAIITSQSLEQPTTIPVILVENSRVALAEAAWAIHDHPERTLTCVAVTGTNGKTTTATLLRSVLEKAGNRTGLVGTLGIFYGSTETESARTTPESSDLAQHFANMRDQGYSHVVMEATSIGIDLERTRGIPFRVAIFTNLTRDHLDYHHTEEAYRNAKLRLFRELPPDSTAVVNADDPSASLFVKATRGRVLQYAIERPADFTAQDVILGRDSVVFTLWHPLGQTRVSVPIIGRFNVQNLLATEAAAYALGIPVDITADALKSAESVRGRAEVVPLPARYTVVVDYAHTPDALEKILTSLRATGASRIITVIGAGGDRDRGKRPLMAEVSARLSDLVILTSDNPRSEDPHSIIEEMASGLPAERKSIREVDRRKAIAQALSEAREGDIVLIAGKGHESYQEIQGNRYPFDDRQVAIEEFSRQAH